jgi:O-antigen ligase
MLAAIIVHMLFAVSHVNGLFPFLRALRPALVTMLVAGALYLAGARGRRSPSLITRERPAKLILALLAWTVFTIPFALNSAAAFMLIVDNYVKTVCFFLLLVGILRGPRDLERAAFWYFLGAMVLALHALRNLSVLLGNSWRMGGVPGTSYDANDLAVLCVSGLPLALHFLRRPGRVLPRVVAAAALCALSAAIVASGSRGGFLALIATGAFILIRFRSIPVRWRLGGVVLVMLTLVATASDRYWEQMNTLRDLGSDYNVEETGRLGIWKRGLGYAARFPLTGVGAGNFSVAEGTISSLVPNQAFGIGVAWTAAHNTYVQVLAELGVPGALLFLGLLAASWHRLSLAERLHPSPQIQSLMQALKASTVGMLSGVFFLSHAYSPMLYALLAIATAAGKVLVPGQTRARQQR